MYSCPQSHIFICHFKERCWSKWQNISSSLFTCFLHHCPSNKTVWMFVYLSVQSGRAHHRMTNVYWNKVKLDAFLFHFLLLQNVNTMTRIRLYLLLRWPLAPHQRFRSSGGKQWAESLSPATVLQQLRFMSQWVTFIQGSQLSSCLLSLILTSEQAGAKPSIRDSKAWPIHARHCGCFITVQDLTAGTWILWPIEGRLKMLWASQYLQMLYSHI